MAASLRPRNLGLADRQRAIVHGRVRLLTLACNCGAESDARSWSFVAVAIMIGVSAASAAARDLVIGINQFPSNLHPNIDSMAAKSYVLGLTQRPFTTYDQRWELVCMLCTELPTLENGKAVAETTPGRQAGRGARPTPSARTPPGATARPITTRDVQFTWEVGRHPKSGVGNAEMYRRFWKLDLIDDKTFTLHDEKLGFNYNAINDFRLLPEHLERPVFEADPATYRNRTLFDTEPTNPGLAFGPYRIAEIAPGSQILLERNPTWWGEPPAFDRIVIKAIENTTALEANLLSGEVDMVEGSVGPVARPGPGLRAAARRPVPGLLQAGAGLRAYGRHARQPGRWPICGCGRRCSTASTAQAISERLFAGRQPVADTTVHPLDWVHTDDVRHYDFDPARAAALLDEAGWRLGDGGLRRNAAGEPLRSS